MEYNPHQTIGDDPAFPLFKLSGRIGRLEYFFILLFSDLSSYALFLLIKGLGGGFLLFVFLSIPLGLIGLIASVKRCHDLQINEWWILLVLVPLVNVIFGLYLLFAKGTGNANKYGPSLRKAPAIKANFDENAAYLQVAKELEDKSIDKALWLKSMVQSGGDEKRQMIAYTELRLQQLRETRQAPAPAVTPTQDNAKEAPSGESQETAPSSHGNDGMGVIAVTILIPLVISVLLSFSPNYSSPTSVAPVISSASGGAANASVLSPEAVKLIEKYGGDSLDGQAQGKPQPAPQQTRRTSQRESVSADDCLHALLNWKPSLNKPLPCQGAPSQAAQTQQAAPQ